MKSTEIIGLKSAFMCVIVSVCVFCFIFLRELNAHKSNIADLGVLLFSMDIKLNNLPIRIFRGAARLIYARNSHLKKAIIILIRYNVSNFIYKIKFTSI